MARDNNGPAIVESTWILMFIASLILIARLYVRAHINRKFSADDWVMLFSYIQTVASSVCFTVAVHYGLGRHQDTLTPAATVEAFKWNLIGQVIGILSGTFARISFCMMLFAITTKQHRITRVLLWSIGVSQLLLNFALSIFILRQCQPITKLWDKSVDGKCLAPYNQANFGFVQGSINSATDLALAIFPATIIWQLNMKTTVKVSLIVMMGLGVFTMVASIVKTVYLKSLEKVSDYSYETSPLIIWFSLEIWFLIIAASIPTIRPLLTKGLRGTTSSKSGGGTGNTGSSSANRWDRRKNFTNIESDQIELTNGQPNARYEPSCVSLEGESRDDGHNVPLEQTDRAGIRKTVEYNVRY